MLVVVQIDTHFVELSRVARLLRQSGEYEPVVWFRVAYEGLDRDLAICRTEGWRHLAPPSTPAQPPKKPRGRRARTLLLPAVPAIARFFPRVVRSLRVYREQVRRLGELLEEQRPGLLLMAEDSIAYQLHLLIKVGRARNIPTVIVPFTIANASEPAEYCFHHAAYLASGSLANRVIAARYPHWVHRHRGRDLLRLPAWEILALELLRLAPRRPWTYNSEETSVIAVENESMLRYYRKEDLPAERLKVTGALYDDLLAKTLTDAAPQRVALYRELALPPDRPLLLCALPPSQFPRTCEFHDYAELVRFWMRALAGLSGWNVLVRPHPRLTAKERESLGGFGVGVTQRDTASLVPLCDLYVASASATIRWAIACGKPAVNYDVYRFGYADYEQARGVVTMSDREAFVAALRELTSDPAAYARLAALQREDMTSWGRLDGKSGERLLRLFDDLTSDRATGSP